MIELLSVLLGTFLTYLIEGAILELIAAFL